MKCWTKKMRDWTGFDGLIWTIELTAVIYGIVGIVIFWSSIIGWFEKKLKKIHDFITKPHKTEFEEDPEF